MTTEQLAALKSIAAKAAEKIRHPDDCDCVAQFNKHFKPHACLALLEEVERHGCPHCKCICDNCGNCGSKDDWPGQS